MEGKRMSSSESLLVWVRRAFPKESPRHMSFWPSTPQNSRAKTGRDDANLAKANSLRCNESICSTSREESAHRSDRSTTTNSASSVSYTVLSRVVKPERLHPRP